LKGFHIIRKHPEQTLDVAPAKGGLAIFHHSKGFSSVVMVVSSEISDWDVSLGRILRLTYNRHNKFAGTTGCPPTRCQLSVSHIPITPFVDCVHPLAIFVWV
jgi:hypothetical protein